MYGVIHEDTGTLEQEGVQLLLTLGVRADAGEVGAGTHPFPLNEGGAGGSDGDDHVGGLQRLLRAGRGGKGNAADIKTKFLCQALGQGRHEALRPLEASGARHRDLTKAGERRQRGGHLEGGLPAAAHHQQVAAVRPGQILGADGAGRAGAQAGDIGGIQQAQGQARFRAEDHDGPRQLRQALFAVAAEPGDGLMAEDAGVLEIAGFDVHIGMAGVKFIKGGGPHLRLAQGLLAVDRLDAGDHLLHGGDAGHILPAKYSDLRHCALLLSPLQQQALNRIPLPEGQP